MKNQTIEQRINQKLTDDYIRSDRYILYILIAHLPFAWLVVPLGYNTHLLGGIPSILITVAAIYTYMTLKGTYWG